MVSDKSKNSSSLTTEQQQQPLSKEAAQAKLAHERKIFKIERAEWTEPKSDFDHWPPEERPFPIEPFPHERQRLPFRMTDEDRQRRKAWVQSQQLADHEPVRVPELETMIYNPIRRLYRVPTDRLFQALTPVLGGPNRAPVFRYLFPKLIMGWVLGCSLWYQLKYNRADWQERKGFTIIKTHGIHLPVLFFSFFFFTTLGIS